MKTKMTHVGAAIGAFFLACTGAMAQVCGGSPNDCCVASPSGTPGCSDSACCAAVCAADPFCCDTQWDSLCAEASLTACLACGAPPACGLSYNDCCVASSDASPFCSDGACCETVCAADPFCCATQWDSICADEAGTMCAGCQSCGDSPNDCCVASPAALPYCSDGECCATVCAADSFCCTTQWDSICASEAATMCLSCGAPPACGFSYNDCCVATGNGTPYCADGACCETVCAADPFCCETQWDSQCASEAHTMCVNCQSCGDSPNDCCVASPTGLPYCSDGTCCSTVCAADPFCCNTQWDNICAGEAGTMCLSCGAPEGCGLSYNASCCVASPTGAPYCSDASCCEIVCGADPFCCDTNWDGLCANQAAYMCMGCASPCPADLSGDGVVNGADLGMLLSNWGQWAAGDLNYDGVVNGADLGIMLAAWGPCSIF